MSYDIWGGETKFFLVASEACLRAKSDRIKNLVVSLSSVLSDEKAATHTIISSILESVRSLQTGKADRRIKRLTDQLRDLQKHLDLLVEMSCRDYLSKIKNELEQLEAGLQDGRVATILSSLVSSHNSSLSGFCELLLDSVIKATQARRGFILFYLPESTEAEIIAGRNFEAGSLLMEESGLSRTILHDALRRGESLLIKDASNDPTYMKALSVAAFELNSVLVVPLRRVDRTIGAIYLDNSSLASAFDEKDRDLLESVSRFVAYFLHQARLIPVAFQSERRVYLNGHRASTEILGRDPKILEIVATINRIADSPAAVLMGVNARLRGDFRLR